MNQHTTTHPDALVLGATINLADAVAIADGTRTLSLHPDVIERCARSHQRLQSAIADGSHVYGLTTGFGPLANRLVSAKDGAILQQNLVHHLATGVGSAFPWRVSRVIVLARLMSILQGVSGASQTAISALVRLLNSPLAPCIPQKGTVGASGDLTPLAHMVLCFQGRGEFETRDGETVSGTKALKLLNIDPLDLAQRDGLALVNGTSAMTGVALCNADLSNRAVHWAERLTAALSEVLKGRTEAWDPAFSNVRPHAGQQLATAALNAALEGAKRVNRTPLAHRKLTKDDPALEAVPGQDAYTLRCAPQVIGAVRDTLIWHEQVTMAELGAATDNPIFPEDGPLHGGNFMGQHVGLVSDALSNAICVLAGLIERQVARLTDERLNGDLPAFLHEGPPGLNSGLMGAQVTATALLAEMRTIGPASVQSISTNAANQDVVSMGTIAARNASSKLSTLFQIEAILALAIAQAIDLIDDADEFSPNAHALKAFVRRHSDRLTTDRPLGAEIEALAHAMSEQSL